MPKEPIKISELTPATSLVGFYTIGYKLVDGQRTSVKLDLSYVQKAYENTVDVTKKANEAAIGANKAKDEANAKMTQISQDVSQVIAETNAAKDAAITATDNAKSVSDHPGYIGTDYHVYTWDYGTGAYNKTDTVLHPEGFSIYRTYLSFTAMEADLANVSEGKFVLINTGSVDDEDTAKLYVRGASSFEYLVDMSGAIGFTGKTPQITIGTVTVGSSASASLSPDGTDDNGNPKFKLNMVIVAGPQGLMPVIETGTVTTGQPGTDVIATLTPNGQTSDGRDKYLLNLAIPQGMPGTGSGNVFVIGSGLVSSKKYLFVPSDNDSTVGTFVEYVVPEVPEQVQPDWNATEGKGAILNRPTIPTKTSDIENDDNTVKDAGYQHTDNNYTDVDKVKLAKINFVPTLDHEPTEDNLTFTDSEGTHTYLIGNQVRVLDAKKSEYVFWQLYDIAAGKANWKKAGSGGDMQLTEKLIITLNSNQAQPDTKLNGLVVHVCYGDNDTPLTWNGTAMTTEIPMNMTYTIEYSALAGYSVPEVEEYIALAGNMRNIEASYNTTILTISVSGNQADKSDLNNLQITLSGSYNKIIIYSGQPLVVNVPTGKELIITPAQIEGYATVVAVTKTPTTSVDAVEFTYQTEVVTVFLNTDTSATAGGQTVTIDGKGYAYDFPVVVKIPYAKSYSVSVNNKIGYTTPNIQSFTANQTTREVIMTYCEIKRGVFILDIDGNLVRRGNWNTSNNSKAVGVALLTDNCKFAVRKELQSALRWQQFPLSLVSGVATKTTETDAVKDFGGSANQKALITALGSQAPAASYCNKMSPINTVCYLGAIGEWQELYNNKAEVDACMTLIGATGVLVTNNYSWTSTQRESNIAWAFHWGYGIVSANNKGNDAVTVVFFPLK